MATVCRQHLLSLNTVSDEAEVISGRRPCRIRGRQSERS